jgi:hypothetical protein
VIASVACLIPLVVIWVIAKSLVPQQSFAMWVILEATIVMSAALAAVFSMVGIRDRPPLFKALGIITFLLALCVGLLEAFWFL